jgi:hypothetical protein
LQGKSIGPLRAGAASVVAIRAALRSVDEPEAEFDPLSRVGTLPLVASIGCRID